jgi:hypothetical protein
MPRQPRLDAPGTLYHAMRLGIEAIGILSGPATTPLPGQMGRDWQGVEILGNILHLLI